MLLIVAAAVPPLVGATSGEWVEEQKMVTSDGADKDYFGRGMAVDGDTLIVGARNDDNGNGDGAGAAYVFTWNGSAWKEEAKLMASDGADYDKFGWSVALDGDTALVGAQYDDNVNGDTAGAVYVFVRDDQGNWHEQAKLIAGDGGSYAHFGDSVALNGTIALVGADNDNNVRGEDAGAAHVYAWNGSTWNEQAKLMASDGVAYGRFGSSVSLDEDTAVVGARNDDNGNGDGAGAAYVFGWNGSAWNEEAKLVASDGASNDKLGDSVVLEGDEAIVGATYADHGGADSVGAAYVFGWNGSAWNEEAKLTASDGAFYDRFGWSMDRDGNAIIVGAFNDDNVNGDEAGAAYVFGWNGSAWNEEAKLTASDGAASDHLGGSVALEEGMALVGASGNDENSYNAGAVYAFVPKEPEPKDTVQDDGGTGGDASDDPDNPSMLPGGTWVPVNGSMAPEVDTVDAYGTQVAADTTESMAFRFEADPGERFRVELYHPDGSLVAVNTTPALGGGAAEISVSAPSGSHLAAGTWTTVVTPESPTGTGSMSTARAPSAPVSPGLVEPGLSLTYDGERECHPRC